MITLENNSAWAGSIWSLGLVLCFCTLYRLFPGRTRNFYFVGLNLYVILNALLFVILILNLFVPSAPMLPLCSSTPTTYLNYISELIHTTVITMNLLIVNILVMGQYLQYGFQLVLSINQFNLGMALTLTILGLLSYLWTAIGQVYLWITGYYLINILTIIYYTTRLYHKIGQGDVLQYKEVIIQTNFFYLKTILLASMGLGYVPWVLEYYLLSPGEIRSYYSITSIGFIILFNFLDYPLITRLARLETTIYGRKSIWERTILSTKANPPIGPELTPSPNMLNPSRTGSMRTPRLSPRTVEPTPKLSPQPLGKRWNNYSRSPKTINYSPPNVLRDHFSSNGIENSTPQTQGINL